MGLRIAAEYVLKVDEVDSEHQFLYVLLIDFVIFFVEVVAELPKEKHLLVFKFGWFGQFLFGLFNFK